MAMLSRVADSLYGMSRYFERADHCARVLEATYTLMLDPSKLSTDRRWRRILASLGLQSVTDDIEPPEAMAKLTADSGNRSSIASCIASARENASQVRELISSEMWERLNQLYHEIVHVSSRFESPAEPLRMALAVREGTYKFFGVTESTMSHGEGWHFIQLGKFIERACALSLLLDAHFSTPGEADDLDWVGLLASCAAFEAYCRAYTADLKPDRVAEFLLLNPEFPHSVRYAADQIHMALEAIFEKSFKRNTRIERMIGQLRASLVYAQIDEIMSRGLQTYLHGVIERCRDLHAALHEIYIDYPIEAAIEA